jgi:hypothetical protein
MSIYDNYKLSIYDNNLTVSKDNIKLFDFSGNSNISYQKLSVPEINFNNSVYGLSFNNQNNNIIINSTQTFFSNDIFISGKLYASEFPSNVVILDNNNKINSSYIPITNNLTLSCNSIGIGVTNSLAKLHIKNGDTIIEDGRLGIGTTISKYNFHLIKNDNMKDVPAFVIQNNNNKIIDIYSEKETVIINNNQNNSKIDSNIKLKIYGTTETSSLNISDNFIGTNSNISIKNDLFINSLNSSNNIINVNSNVDFIISNISIGSIISNIIDINNCFDVQNNKILFSSNIYFDINTSSNYINIVNNDYITTISSNSTIIPNLITSNINLINYDSLTSNPNKESVFDIKGKIRLYNDSPFFVISCYTNNNNLYFITNNNKLYSYNLNSKLYSLISNNFYYSIFKAKFNSYAYYYNNSLIINENSYETTISNINILDFAINNNISTQPLNKIIYYINQFNQVVSYNLTTLISTINTIRNDIIKIDTYFDNTYIVLTKSNSLFHFNGSIFTPIIFNNISPSVIIDFSCGDCHTLILTNLGVYSCGYININTATYKKGYINEGTSPTTAYLIESLSNINKIKASNNSSIVIDNNGYAYIFGTINRLFNSTIIFKIEKYYNFIDLSCNNNELFLLSYYNDLITISDNNNTNILILPNNFYGTSIKSRGSIIIGGDNFYNIPPRNSLLVENFIGIGSSNIYSSNYSLVVSGNVNVINGSIYNNGILLSSSSTNSSNSSTWIKNNNDIFYIIGNVGIGVANPKSKLHLNGDAIFDDNVYINGNLITKEYKPLVINKERNIYYNGLFGINTNNPQGSIHIFNGSLVTSSTIFTSNQIILNSFSLNVNSSSLSTSYINPTLINQNGDIIINSFYNLDLNFNNNNNNNIEIYKLINNNWITYKINDNSNINSAFGEGIAISKSGSSIFIGAYKERNLLTNEITGCIYRYSFDNNNIIKNSEKIIAYNNIDNNYYQIGRNIICSGNGYILISTINNYTDLLYIKNLFNNTTTLLDFSIYDYFHSSFSTSYTTNQFANNSFSYNNLSLDTSDDGSIILINFIYNTTSGILINNFNYFNFYIVNNNEIFLLKFTPNFNNSGNINANVTSVSISADSSKIFITTYNGFNYIYDFNFILDTYKTTNIINNTVIKYYDKTPSFVFFRKEDNFNYSHFRGKISKSGDILYIGNTKSIFIYKLNKIDNSWISQLLIPNLDQLTNINNYSISIDYNGYNCALSYLRKTSDSIIDNIQITNTYFNFLEEKTNLILDNDNLNVNLYSYFNSNIYAPYYYGSGSYLTNISQSNILSTNQIGVIYTSNNRYYNNNNFYWNDSNNSLNISSNVDTCNLLVKNIYINNIHTDDIYFPKSHHFTVPFGGTSLSNLSSNSFMIGNGQNPIIMSSNLQWINRLSRLVFSNNATFVISSNPPIINVPFIFNSHYSEIIATSNGGTGQNNYKENCILYHSSNKFQTTNNLYWSNISSNLYLNGSLNVLSNIFVKGVNISNIDVNNFTSVVPIYKGGTGTSNFNDGWLLIGANSNQGNINSYSNLRWDNDNSNLITCNISLSNINFLDNFSNTSKLFIHPNSIYDTINLNKGGLGITNIPNGCLLFGFDSNSININSNIIWSNNERILDIKYGTILSSNNKSSYFYGDGSNITNITINNLNGIIPISKGGTGRNYIEEGLILIGNNSNQINTTDNLKWNSENSILITSNLSISSNLLISGSNFYDIIKNPNSIGIDNNKINGGELIFTTNSKTLDINNNLKWNNLNNLLEINNGSLNTSNIIASNIYLNGKDISIINTTDLSGILSVSNGGTGLNIINEGSILIGSNNNSLITYDEIKWDNITSTLLVDNIKITSNLTINNASLSSIIANIDSNLILSNLGFNNNEIQGGELLISDNSNTLSINSNLRWNNITSTLLVDNIKITSNLTINNASLSSIIANIDSNLILSNLGFNNNEIQGGELLISDNSNTLSINSNLRWNNLENLLNINNGSIISSNITGKNLVINGNIYSSGEIYTSSDIRLKTNISLITDPINKIKQLNGVYYNLISNQKRSIGLIAQDVEKIIPEIVYTNTDNTKAIAYTNMMGLIVESIKELSMKICDIEEKLNYININRI